MKLLLIIIISLITLNVKAKAETIKIIAIIGNQVITNYDLKQKIKLIEFNSNKKIAKDHLPAIYNQVREQLITESIYNIEANKLNISANKEQIEEVYKSFLKERNIVQDKFLEILKNNKIDFTYFNDQLKNSLNWQNILYYKIRPTIKISETEINDYIQNIADENNDFEYLVQIINFPINENIFETKSLLNDIYNKVKNGKLSFSQIRALYSLSKIEEPVWKLKSEFDDNIQNNLSILSDGEISSPIKYKDKFKLLFLKEKRLKENKKNNRKFRNEIKQKLYLKKLESAAARYTQQLRKNSYIERKRL